MSLVCFGIGDQIINIFKKPLMEASMKHWDILGIKKIVIMGVGGF